MKRFGLVMLSVGLVLAFSASALAVDVKFSGSYYAAGMYLDKTNLMSGIDEGQSTAFYYQRLRVRTDFIVSPGLSLITRFDAMERAWGASRSAAGANSGDWLDSELSATSAGTTAENENIAFDLAYIQYASPVGTFTFGYQNDGTWGTVFGDSSVPRGKIGWSLRLGDWTVLAQIVKFNEQSHTAKNSSATTTDLDADMYIAGFIYNWKGGEAGMRYTFYRDATWKTNYPDPSFISMHSLQPYAIAKIGPVTVQAELDYYLGKEEGLDGSTYYEGDREEIDFFLDVLADFNMFYVGGTYAYLSGDHRSTNYYEDIEGGTYVIKYNGVTGGGIDWSPCLIMFNFDRTYWAGGLYGYGGGAVSENGGIDSPMFNAFFWQIRGGVRPIAALDIMASVSYAAADETLHGYDYGTEVDLIATYKITNNLSYMLGVGYLFTGDYFKAGTTNDVEDNFLVINKLTLTF